MYPSEISAISDNKSCKGGSDHKIAARGCDSMMTALEFKTLSDSKTTSKCGKYAYYIVVRAETLQIGAYQVANCSAIKLIMGCGNDSRTTVTTTNTLIFEMQSCEM